MGRFLTNNDYKYTIQNSQLNQLLNIPGIGGGPNNSLPPENNPKLLQAERIAIDEVSSYLVQRWDLSRTFTDTNIWDFNKAYNADDRIILDYNSFTSSVAYATGSCVIYNSVCFMSLGIGATTSVPVEGANWTNIGNQYDMYYAIEPLPLYDGDKAYKLNDTVYWKGYTYSAARNSNHVGQQRALQYGQIQNIPSFNIPPDSSANYKNDYWFNNGTYSIPLAILPTNTGYWTKGDNRSQQIMVAVQDVAIYHLSKSLAPMNIPDLRNMAYSNTIKTLKSAAKGDVAISLPELEPSQGIMTRYYGAVRKNNQI